MKNAASILTLCIAGAFLASPAAAQGDAERGAKLAYTCQGCHGIEGYRNAYPSYRVPKLGGQKAAYLVAALQGYRDGTREHATMQAQAASMTDQDMQDLAAYFSSIANETVAAGGTEAAGIEAASLNSGNTAEETELSLYPVRKARAVTVVSTAMGSRCNPKSTISLLNARTRKHEAITEYWKF